MRKNIGGHRKVLQLDKQNYQTNLSQYEGLSLREIARRSGHHFNTVKKYVDREDWNETYKARKEKVSLLEPLEPKIDGWIMDDLKRSRKFRRTGTKIYNDLRNDDELNKMLLVGKQTVINYVSHRKKELCKKTYENYSFEDIKLPSSLSVDDIKDSVFIPRRENLIFYGNVGAGKTHLAIATGIAACNAGFRTRFWRTAALVNALTEAKQQGSLSRFIKQIEKLDLLICDEWGYVPIDSDGSKLLFQVISECYERKSLIITTNLEFSRWNDIFADTKITAALLDRIIHHSHLLDFTNRNSRRLQDALLSRSPNSDIP